MTTAECRIEFSESPTDMIVKVAQELPADLVVMNARREASLAADLSDTASKVVTGAPCPVADSEYRSAERRNIN